MDIDTEFARPTLDQLAHQEPVARLWTDKRTRREGDGDYVLHGYTPFYDREFTKFRDQPIRLLEIGLNVGASIKLWLEYFSQARLVGVDIVDFKFATEIENYLVNSVGLHRFDFVKGDALSPQFWERFRRDQQPFDIIIDDGAHSSGTIVMAFNNLWEHVRPGGYYCIEDFAEVKNLASHTPGYPTQVEFAESLLGRIILGYKDIEEAHVSKELLMLRKKS